MKTITNLMLGVAVAAGAGCAPGDAPPDDVSGPHALDNGSFSARLNDFRIHYEVHGQGPVLMVLPNSWGLSLEGLRSLFGALEEKLTMVYFDPRGMGQSEAIREASDMGLEAVRNDFHALREHLGLESVNAIGWSNGAMNLILLAAEHPETIDAAILVHGTASFTAEDSQAWVRDYPELMQRYSQFMEEMQNPELSDAEKTERQRDLWLEEWFPLSFADRVAAPEILDRLFGDAEFSWAHADYSQRMYPEFDARDRLPLITARCLVVVGAHDMMPASKGEEMADGLANASLVVFESSGHYAPAEEPDRFQDLVFGFLDVS